MYERTYFIIKNKFWKLSTEEVIYKIFDKNIMISSIAKEELLNRNLSNINVSDDILKKVILNLSIEQIYDLVVNHQGSRLSYFASIEFNKILEDAKNNYLVAFYDKVNDQITEGEKPKLKLIKN